MVLDRLLFEDVTVRGDVLCRIDLWDDRTNAKIGSVSWGGGRIEDDSPRPGTRLIWSTARWPLPDGVRRIRFAVSATVQFSCRVDVDLFFDEDFQ